MGKRDFGTFLLMAAAGVVAYQYFKDDGNRQAPAAQLERMSLTTPASAQPAGPADQKAFIEAVVNGKASYDAGINDMQKGAARPKRAKALCGALSGKRITAWVGTVYKLSTNSDGKGVLELQIAPNIYIKTWNNSFSDISDHTLIDPDSSLFSSASALSEGETVSFSGSFIPNGVDCVREGSMSMAGSMTEPEFIFRFNDIGRR